MQKKKACVIDIESNGLLSDMLDFKSLPYKLKNTAKLWCVVISDVETGEIFYKEGNEITAEWLDSVLSDYYYIIAHNGLKFDFPALFFFKKWDYRIGYLNESDTLNGRSVRFIDTLILSRISNPDRFGGHSLSSWGKRVGEVKTDYRQQCIDEGYINRSSPKGEEFKNYNPLMLPYCIQDCKVNVLTYKTLAMELNTYNGWAQAIKQEHKLADLAIRRELFGFSFDKDLAIKCVEDLTAKMSFLSDIVSPILPPRKLNKGEEDFYTPPKNQVKADGTLSKSFLDFTERVGALIKDRVFIFEGSEYNIPLDVKPLKTHLPSSIKDMDVVKGYLIDLGWNPTEWKERDLTRNSKKQPLSIQQQHKALDKWYSETINGKYTKDRVAFVCEKYKCKSDNVLTTLKSKLGTKFPVKVITSPSIRVGVEKKLCPELVKLGNKVSFAKDFADYLTYKHRKSSIVGGDTTDMDFDEDVPDKGYLSMYREEDGRIPTPAIEIGASTHRYTHIGVANIPRATSIYGKEMRSLFGCGEGYVQLGFDFASLEARVEGSFCYHGTDGVSYAESLTAENPNDVHTINSIILSIDRGSAKSFKYALTYGAQVSKIMKMLSASKEKAEGCFEAFWNAAPSLKELKVKIEQEWITNDKLFIRGIDGRKIYIRSQHSILNALFQSTGVIAAKYTLLFAMQELEEKGYCIDCFRGIPDVAEMISYHDEAQLAIKKEIAKYKIFNTKDEAKKFTEDWQGEQLSAISSGNKWYITLPNDVSISLTNAVKKTGELLSLNVPLGIEWIVNKNWYGCH
jgi:hypothetical protein